jgi:hypothetical protein
MQRSTDVVPGYGLIWVDTFHGLSKVIKTFDTRTQAHTHLAKILMDIVHGRFPYHMGFYNAILFYHTSNHNRKKINWRTLELMKKSGYDWYVPIVEYKRIRIPWNATLPIFEAIRRINVMNRKELNKAFKNKGGRWKYLKSRFSKQLFILRKEFPRANVEND